jgi:hypothetical protein
VALVVAALGVAAALVAALGDDGDDALAALAPDAPAAAAAALVILLGDGDGDLLGDFLRAAEFNILSSTITSIKKIKKLIVAI